MANEHSYAEGQMKAYADLAAALVRDGMCSGGNRSLMENYRAGKGLAKAVDILQREIPDEKRVDYKEFYSYI